ncbi:MAG: transglutaminase domain-containing protein [Rufibacter sp.]
MKLILSKLFLVLFFLSPILGKAQYLEAFDYRAIDKFAMKAPDSHRKSVVGLTNYLVKPYETEVEKVRSIYAWIVYTLNYDHALARMKDPTQRSIQNTLSTKKAICGGYANLVKAMCDIAGIECVVIAGYTRRYNFEATRKKRFTWSEHAWNAVKIEGEWFLLDATWEEKETVRKGTTYIRDYCFLKEPRNFIIDHLPEDPIWQFLPCPITLQDFQKGIDELEQMLVSDALCEVSYQDSLQALPLLEENYRELLSAQRAFQFNPLNHRTVGYALLNYGNHLRQLALSNRTTTTTTKIAGLEQSQDYLEEALKNLRKTDRTKQIKSCKRSIASGKKKLKKLRETAKKEEKKKELATKRH